MKYLAYIFTTAVIIVVAIPFIIHTLVSSPEQDNVPEAVRLNLSELSEMSIMVFHEDENVSAEYPLEEYVAGVVASEMPASFEEEALKAQAVAARTYALSRQEELCDTVHCQVFRTEDELRAIKGDKWMKSYWDKIRNAVGQTAGEVIYYEDSMAKQTLFHSSSGGKTENSEEVFVSAVPYLRSVDSPYEEEATHINEEKVISKESFVSIINAQPEVKPITVEEINSMQITKKSTGGRVALMKIGENEFTGVQIRNMLNLSSSNFTYETQEENVIIITNGFGHGVGMSQYGANGMAKKGYTYDEILKHYYSGIEIKKYEQL